MVNAPMRPLLCTEFAALLARTGVGQAGFARLTGLTQRHVNSWCRGRAGVPAWAAALAVLLEDHAPEGIAMMLDEAVFAWHEILGVPPTADASTVRRAATRLAHSYHPAQGGTQEQMTRITAAYAQAKACLEDNTPSPTSPPPPA
jgi:hypothetical protein